MTTATIADTTKAEAHHTPQASARGCLKAARAFRRLRGVDAVWLAVRESRAETAVVCCTDGIRSATRFGMRVEPGVGVGGRCLVTGELWDGEVAGRRARFLSADEFALLTGEGMKRVLVVPLRPPALTGAARTEGIAYVATRRRTGWTRQTVEKARRIGRRVARAVRDAQRVLEAAERWERMSVELAASGETADLQLDRVVRRIASDVRTILRSGIGIVFRLDSASGALHSLGQDGEVVPGEIVSAVSRGQVLPPGFGCAGRAVALRKPFIAPDYGAECLVVPPMMMEALTKLPPLTTMSFPLLVGSDVIGAVTVGRIKGPPAGDYSTEDARLAGRLARLAGLLLARAQRAAEHARREQGAFELSRLAGSLIQSLSVSAVCEQLVRSVLSLVHGGGAVIWSSQGRALASEQQRPGMIPEPRDERLDRILNTVARSRQPFWTSDLANDPRLASLAAVEPRELDDARAVLVAPVRIRDALLGLLGVIGETGRVFTDADVELVQALADQAALGIANARAYDELQLSNLQVLRHEKLVAMGRLASELAHELRNPLQNVVGLTAELVEHARGSLRQRPEFVDFPEYLRRAHCEAKRAAEIVDRLLDHVRERTPTLDAVDLRRIVADAVLLVKNAAARQGAEITVLAGDDPVVVRADAIMLRQVVLNLVNNAIDALNGAGSVVVRIRSEREGIGGARAAVSVVDTGRGIRAEHLPHIFDPFFTSKEDGQGIGLGLAICQSFIEQHGGTIQAESAGVGLGTTVEFELPLEP
jgi:signal transduction histidine kinase